MNKNNEFRSVAKFWYKNTHYQMFINSLDQVAYLIINDKDEYEYPTLKQLLEVNAVIHNKPTNMVYGIVRDENNKRKNKKQKKAKFIPKVIVGGVAVALSTVLISQIISFEHDTYRKSNDKDNNVEISYEDIYEDINDDEINNIINQYNNNLSEDTKKDNNQNGEKENNNDEEVDELTSILDSYGTQSTTSPSGKKYFEYNESLYSPLLASADGEGDFKYETDYIQRWNNYYFNDASSFSQYFNYDKPTYDDLVKAVDKNNSISAKYKDFIKTYINDWLTMWPDSDLSVFYYNIQSLAIVECDPQEIQFIALNPNTVACYTRGNNTIYVREGIDFSDKTSDDYIVLAHELTHAARTITKTEGDNHYYFATFDLKVPYEAGCYYEESVITNLMYDMQGEDKKSIFYTVPCSYYRIIMDCVGYDGNDFMNHSSTYMADKMGDFMGDDSYAYYIMQLIGYNYLITNNNYVSVEIESFEPLYEYITQMYMKKYLKEGMTSEEAEEVFTNFTNEMTWNTENLKNDYAEANPDTFRPYFEECCNNLGIDISNRRSR